MAAIAPVTKKRGRSHTTSHTPKPPPGCVCPRHLTNSTLRPPAHQPGNYGLLRIPSYFFVTLLQHCALGATGLRRSKGCLLAVRTKKTASALPGFPRTNQCSFFCLLLQFPKKEPLNFDQKPTVDRIKTKPLNLPINDKSVRDYWATCLSSLFCSSRNFALYSLLTHSNGS